MLIAAWAVGINDIYIYLRDEYACRAILERELAVLADPPCLLPEFICAAAPAPTSAAKSRR